MSRSFLVCIADHKRDLHSKTTENECTVRIASNLKFGHVEILLYINRAGYMSGYFRLMKQCNKCGEVKVLTEYHKNNKCKDKLSFHCKLCEKKQKKIYNQNNKETRKKYRNNRRLKDPKYRLLCNFRSRLQEILGGGRSKHTLEVLGCSLEELKQHIESQFQPWMTWENMGGRSVSTPNTTWDIDHIIPLSSAQTEEDVYRLSHYTNLQPLCSYHNRFIKRDKY
jgi:hypothetical protein